MAEGGTARLLGLTKVRNCQFLQTPFRVPVGYQALLPYVLCIGPNQQGSGSAKTVCFYWQTFGRRVTGSTTWGTSGSDGLMRSLSANQRRASLQSRPNQSACQKV